MNCKLLVFVLAITGLISTAKGDVLAQFPAVFSGSLNTTSDPYFTFSLLIETPPPPPPPFNDQNYPPSPNPRDTYTFPNLTAAQDGMTFTITAADDPGLFATIALNSPLDEVTYRVASPVGGGGAGTGFSGTQFTGMTVSSLTFTLNQLSTSVDDSSPNPFQYSFNGTVTANGVVATPEPSAWVLGMLAAGLFFVLRRKGLLFKLSA